MGDTKIEWAQKVWNPVSGCTKVSQGCKNCYAKTLHDRRHTAYLNGAQLPAQYAVPFEQVQLIPGRLDDPLRWREPKRIFVNSVSDLFHPDVNSRFIASVWLVMQRASQHTFMILTKRPERMQELISEWTTGHSPVSWPDWPLPNVWLGVSVEDQKAADERIPQLLETPAAVRFVSAEPLLGAVHLLGSVKTEKHWFSAPMRGGLINWVICGGESGPGARPMHPAWALSLRDQCQAAGAPFFLSSGGNGLRITHKG